MGVDLLCRLECQQLDGLLVDQLRLELSHKHFAFKVLLLPLPDSVEISLRSQLRNNSVGFVLFLLFGFADQVVFGLNNFVFVRNKGPVLFQLLLGSVDENFVLLNNLGEFVLFDSAAVLVLQIFFLKLQEDILLVLVFL